MDNIKLTVTPQTNFTKSGSCSSLPTTTSFPSFSWWPHNSMMVTIREGAALPIKWPGDFYMTFCPVIVFSLPSVKNCWCINSATYLKIHQKELANSSRTFMLKMNRIYFADRDENMAIVSSLEKLRVRVTQEIENGNDFKGNKKHLFEQNVQHEIRLQFTLVVPLYKGQEKKSFLVDVNFDITDGNTVFWLESVDLKELMETERIRIIDSQISKMGGLTIIYQ